MVMNLGLIWGLLSPDARARIERGERSAFERAAAGAEPWDEDKTKFKKFLVLDGNTFKPQQLFDIAPVNLCKGRPTESQQIYSPGKVFTYYNALLPRGRMLDLWQGGNRGKVAFTTDVVIPTLAKGPNWAKPVYDHEVWMSYTPAEVISQRQGVRLAAYRLKQSAEGRDILEELVGNLANDVLALPAR